MKRIAWMFAAAVVIAPATSLGAPGSMEITCDVDRVAFRSLARNATEVTFRLWDSDAGGSQCGPDYTAPLADLVLFRRYTDRTLTAASPVQRKKTLRVAAVIGSDAAPVELCAGDETWLDVSIGTATLTCDFSSQSPAPRRRLHAQAFVAGGGTAGVSQVDTGAGLQGGPITSSGMVSVLAPTCSGTEKLAWNGAAFTCSGDENSGGTVTSVATGAGLTGGTITGSGTISVNAPACAGTDKLTWNGSGFQCTSDQVASSAERVRVVAEGAGSVTATCPAGKSIEAGWYFRPGDAFPRACTVGSTSCSWSSIFTDVSVVDITCN